MLSRCRSDVKNVTRFGLMAAVIDLLGDDFSDGLKPHRTIRDLANVEWLVGEMTRGNEIDLANVSEGKLLEAGSISTIVGWHFPEMKVHFGGVEKSQNLAVIEKDIDIVALAMTKLDHHRRAAAERPPEIVPAHVFARLVKQVTGYREQPWPFGGALVVAFNH
jgi:hypothetical protein